MSFRASSISFQSFFDPEQNLRSTNPSVLAFYSLYYLPNVFMEFHSFIFTNCFFLVKVMLDLESISCRNTGCEAGIHPGWHAHTFNTPLMVHSV